MSVIGLSMPTAAVSKSALLPAPAISVTPVGLPFKAVNVVAVPPSNTLSAPVAKTSMRWVSVAPPLSTKLAE